jgi:alanyl-tRNA synthetase
VAQGVDASELVRDAVAQAGGKGGGRPQMAQGKVPGVDALESALQKLRERLQG